MAGHSKWANIKHRKGAADAKRSKLFTKLIKEIMVAAKVGGHDPDSNPRLRMAIQNAKGASVPKDNIERAINKGSGQDDGDYKDLSYEGYGPHGVAIFVDVTTDNINRTVQNIKSFLNKAGGSMSTNGSLDFIFDEKGIFNFPFPEGRDEDEFILELIDLGAEEAEVEDNAVQLTCLREDFGNVQQGLHEKGIEPESSGLQRIPKLLKAVNRAQAEELSKLLETIEDDDDVKAVYHNIEFSEELADLF